MTKSCLIFILCLYKSTARLRFSVKIARFIRTVVETVLVSSPSKNEAKNEHNGREMQFLFTVTHVKYFRKD